MSYLIDSHTVSLLHFDNDFKDECGKIWAQTVNSNPPPIISSDQSKFGHGSLYLYGPGTSLYRSGDADFNFGSNDFTIDFWMFIDLARGQRDGYIFSIGLSRFALFYNNSGGNSIALGLVLYDSSGARIILDGGIGGGGLGGRWSHFCITKNGSTIYVFLDGNITKTFTNIGALYPLSGSELVFTIGGGYCGYIDEFRVSNIARSILNFTPPTSAYVKLYNETFKDRLNILHGYK